MGMMVGGVVLGVGVGLFGGVLVVDVIYDN